MKRFKFVIQLIVSFYTNAQETVHVDLSNAHATIYTHLFFLQDDSYQPKKAAATILGLEEEMLLKKPLKLKKIDGKGLFVDVNKIPVDPN